MMSAKLDRYSSIKLVTWFSRILRWSSGLFFIGTGIWYFHEGGWPAILFGSVLFITGFFKPTRCLGESCTLPTDSDSKKKISEGHSR